VAEPVSVVHVLVAGEATEDGLTELRDQRVTAVLPSTRINEQVTPAATASRQRRRLQPSAQACPMSASASSATSSGVGSSTQASHPTSIREPPELELLLLAGHRRDAPTQVKCGPAHDRQGGRGRPFASRLDMAGVDLRTIRELMGHKTLAMPLRYAHLSPTHLHAAVRALDAPAGGRTDSKPAPEQARRAATGRQVLESTRAGDRGRTDDLVLGKHTL